MTSGAIGRSGGFTLVELITVMLLIGILAAIGVPRLMNGNDGAALTYGDQVASALRLAQKTAVAHRRTVCVGASSSAMTLRIATAVGSSACGAALEGVDDADYRSGAAGVTSTGLAGGSASAPNRLLFQPDGTIAGADGTPARGVVTIVADGRTVRTIRVEGVTGYVE